MLHFELRALERLFLLAPEIEPAKANGKLRRPA